MSRWDFIGGIEPIIWIDQEEDEPIDPVVPNGVTNEGIQVTHQGIAVTNGGE